MARSAIQLYTLRHVDLPFTAVLERVAAAGFDGVEFAYRGPDEDPTEVVETLERTGLTATGAHVGIEDLEVDTEETLAFYEAIGCEDLVVPGLAREFFSSYDGVAEACDRLATIEAELAERGMALHYHNHDHEYVELNGSTGFDAFVETTEVGIELDTGLALLGGDDPVARLRSLGDRTSFVHLKDVDIEAGESVVVGEGDLDVDGCAEAFLGNGGEWVIYEYEGEDALDTLEDAATTINELCR